MDMKGLWNPGAMGVEQYIDLGEITFAAEEAVTMKNVLPKGFRVTQFICDVTEAFNAATTNVLLLGNASDDDAYMTADNITEGTVGVYKKEAFLDVGASDIEVKASYTSTGADATAGKAHFYAKVVRLA